jgi:HSP20 family protein
MPLIRRENREPARNRGQEYGLDPTQTWDPFRLMDTLLRWDPFREGRGWAARGMDNYYPHFDVKETPDGYWFTADLPGVKEGDLDISVTGNVLTVSGKREEERVEENAQYYAMERGHGQFTRSFSLPDGADTGNVKADLKDGVLQIQLGKRSEVQPKKISIGTTSSGAKA